MQLKVALIDDDPVFSVILKKLATRTDIAIENWESAEQFLSQAKTEKYDVLVFDYYLDRFKGSNLARIVHTFYPSIPIIIISSCSDWWLTTKQEGWGVSRFIHKDQKKLEIIREIMEVGGESQDETSILQQKLLKLIGVLGRTALPLIARCIPQSYQS